MNKNFSTRIAGLLFAFAVSIALAGANTVFAHSRTIASSMQMGASSHFALLDGSGPDGMNRKRKGKGMRTGAAKRGAKKGTSGAKTPLAIPGATPPPATGTPGTTVEVKGATGNTPSGATEQTGPPASGGGQDKVIKKGDEGGGGTPPPQPKPSPEN